MHKVMATIKISDLLNNAGEARPAISEDVMSVVDKSIVMDLSEQTIPNSTTERQKSTMSESPRALDELVMSLAHDPAFLTERDTLALAKAKDEKGPTTEREEIVSEEMLSLYAEVWTPRPGQEAPAGLSVDVHKTSNSSAAHFGKLSQQHKSTPFVSVGNANLDPAEVPKSKSVSQGVLACLPQKTSSQNISKGVQNRAESTLKAWAETKWSTAALPMKHSIEHISDRDKRLHYLLKPKTHGHLSSHNIMKHGASIRQRRAKRRDAVAATKLEKRDIILNDKEAAENPERMLEKRMKNRAAVNKCRLKQKERLEQLQSEQIDLMEENRHVRELLETLGQSGMLETFDIEIISPKEM